MLSDSICALPFERSYYNLHSLNTQNDVEQRSEAQKLDFLNSTKW